MVPANLRRTHKGKPDTTKGLLEIQNQYSIGPVAATIRNKDSNNVYGIIRVWPDYKSMVTDGKISPYTSVTLGNPAYDKNRSPKFGS